MAKDQFGELTAHYDDTNQIVCLVGQGSWTVPMLKQHQLEIAAIVERARRDREHLLILSDIRLAAVQTQEVASEIARYSPQFARRTDRIATVVASSLVKMQMRRLSAHDTWEFFMSHDAATRWLLAYEPECLPGPMELSV